MNKIFRFSRCKQPKAGASALGYGLVVGLIAVVSIGAITSVGGNVDSLFTGVADNLEDSTNGTVALPSASASASASPSPAALTSCQAHRDAGSTSDGTYSVDPDGPGNGLDAFDVYCDMDGVDGWTLWARNVASENGTNSWHLYWQDYKDGFGGVASGSRSNGWIGNDRLHALTVGGVDLEVRQVGGPNQWPYINFSVGDESSNYVLSVTNTGGSYVNFGNSHNGMQFSTRDRDNDTHGSTNCASNTYNSGWWYYSCWGVVIHHEPALQGYWDGPKDLEWYLK